MRLFVKFLFLLCFVQSVFAENDIQIDGNIQVATEVKNHPYLQLMKLKISDHGQRALYHRLKQTRRNDKKMLQFSQNLIPSQHELGMNNVPVLDQGYHSSCATFAVTAAIDATINKGDYISQLCLLSLSEHLSKHAQFYSAWHGAQIKDIFSLISIFGVVNKSQEAQYGCAGFKTYPLLPTAETPEISIDDFHQLSESIDDLSQYAISNFVNPTELEDNSSSIQQILMNTKEAIYHGNRLVIGLIMIADEHVGAYGKHHLNNDTWVLSQSVQDKFNSENTEIGGHAMVITGYDDNAEVIDDAGKIHHGVFTLRNSWGSKAGDQGNYYVSYDYFEALVIDLTKIKLL
jgi:hypothetical protein